MEHFYIDKYSDTDSLIHRLDPRVKIISFVAFIVFVIFTAPYSFISFGLYGAFITILILLSRIPLRFILKKSLIIIPFVVMVAIFIPFIKDGEIAGGYSLGTLNLTVTYDGLMIFWNTLVKSYLSILSMILLAVSGKFSHTLRAFERLKCPKLITMIFSFMYRYIFVVQDELMRIKRAKEARTVCGSKWLHIKALANIIGVLFIKTYERAESVYLAMCSRGFTGKVRTIDDFQLKIKDFCFLLITVGVLIGIRILVG